MTEADTIYLGDYPSWRATDAKSPFRYPGGKGFLTGFLATELERLNRDMEHYVEPFAGGAGAAFNLLSLGKVRKIHLNDLDVRVYSAWKAILTENERFVEAVRSCDISIDHWNAAKAIVEEAGDQYSFEIGFATFFVNRTSRSGIITGSGPIGGYEQSGDWNLGARFYRDTIVSRLKWIGEVRDCIELSNLTSIDFLKRCTGKLSPLDTFYFIDPPYVKAGSRLYLDGMLDGGHEKLGKYLKGANIRHWAMTYDDHPLVRKIYRHSRIRHLQVNYSLGRARKENEVLITPKMAA